MHKGRSASITPHLTEFKTEGEDKIVNLRMQETLNSNFGEVDEVVMKL